MKQALTFFTFLCAASSAAAQDAPLLSVTFDGEDGALVRSGRSTEVVGVRGRALRLDGFTSELRVPADRAPSGEVLGRDFTIEAWLAPAAYPWNWCPIVAQGRENESGYAFEIGPRGELRFAFRHGTLWTTYPTSASVVPLRTWTHVAARVADGVVSLWVNGEEVGSPDVRVGGDIAFAPDEDLRIGCLDAPRKPSDIHREFGTLPFWFCFDGILDEVTIRAGARTPDALRADYERARPAAAPDLPERRLPFGPPGPGRFGAYYEKLEYYPEWDALWSIDEDADVVVRFDKSAARVIFWRGTRYSPAWVTENDLWMADQSVEAWNQVEGCFEHMQDRRCRYSHVRIIESNDARVVVQWRYALVSAHDHLWNEDPKTTRGCWIDEYYTIYPDLTGVRRPTWKTGKLGSPHQFQESTPLTHPGQLQGEVVEADWCTVANLGGESAVLRHVENPKKQEEKTDLPSELTVQRYDFRSRQDPFIVFEEGNRMMYLGDRNVAGLSRQGSCNHWPVGQAICDGRSSPTSDRPTSFLGFPISYPPVHVEGDRSWWSGLYGLTELPMEELLVVARSWNRPPDLRLGRRGFESLGYDRGQRAWVIRRVDEDRALPLYLELAADAEHPVYDPAFVVEGWGEAGATLRLDDTPVPRGPDFRYGHRRRLERTDLVVWIRASGERPLSIELAPLD